MARNNAQRVTFTSYVRCRGWLVQVAAGARGRRVPVSSLRSVIIPVLDRSPLAPQHLVEQFLPPNALVR